MKAANVLEALRFRNGWIYETIFSTYSGKIGHCAPMGVSTPDGKTLTAEVYKTSKTCANIVSKRAYAVNLSSDIRLFYDACYRRDAISYLRAQRIDAPIIAQSDASIEVAIELSEDMGDRIRFSGKIVAHTCRKPPADIRLLNRGDALALEVLICASRISHASASQRESLKEEIRRICRVLSRVAPGSDAEKLANDLSSRL